MLHIIMMIFLQMQAHSQATIQVRTIQVQAHRLAALITDGIIKLNLIQVTQDRVMIFMALMELIIHSLAMSFKTMRRRVRAFKLEII